MGTWAPAADPGHPFPCATCTDRWWSNPVAADTCDHGGSRPRYRCVECGRPCDSLIAARAHCLTGTD